MPQALEAYRQVLTVNPKNLEARLRLGILLEKTNQLAEAKQAYQQIIAQQPQYVEALLRLGILAERQKQPQEALTAYRAIVAQQPDNVEAQYRLAVLNDTQGDIKQAISAYARVLTLQHTLKRRSTWAFCRRSKARMLPQRVPTKRPWRPSPTSLSAVSSGAPL